MNKFAISLLLLLSFNAQSQIPDYFANNPTWYCGFWNSNQLGEPPLSYSDEYVYYLNGDTTALGYTYYRVFKRGYKNYDLTQTVMDETFNYQTEYYIRQEGRSIRFFTNAINTDSLLVSYDYQLGDRVAGDLFADCHSSDTIQKIDSILINSEYRRVFYLDSLNGPVVTEGIGHQNELTGHSGGFLESLCVGLGFEYYINCYGQNETPLWDSEGNGGSCYLNVGLEETPDLSFELSPNPASTQFTIQSASDEQFQIEVIDFRGNVVLKTTERTVLVEGLDSGVYLVVLTDQSGNSGRMKVVVE